LLDQSKKLAKDKHSSLLRKSANQGQKSFIILSPDGDVWIDGAQLVFQQRRGSQGVILDEVDALTRVALNLE
jgi:hypothetical protein